MKILNKNIVWFGLFIFILFLSIDFLSPVEKKLTRNNIGFFSPNYLDAFIFHVNFSMMNIYYLHNQDKGELQIDLDSLKNNLDYVNNIDHRVHLDLGPVITSIKKLETINTYYENSQGEILTKIFKPQSYNKIKEIISDKEIEHRLFGLANILKTYRNNIGIIFIADEPYLNGISKDELNRAVLTLKRIFKKNDLDGLEYGVIFASGLFDSQFAKHINSRMNKYVEGIDEYYQSHQCKLQDDGSKSEEFNKWLNTITKYRLTTYDSANNIYMGGGIPTELDVVAFDFYLSTLLFDQIHEDTLDYFSTSLKLKSCRTFSSKTISSIRHELSFIQDGLFTTEPNAYKNDKALLDAIFDCRMTGGMTLLGKALHALPKQPKLMLIGESSANGVLEFDKNGRIEPDQPELLVEQRILDEVKRSYHYYKKNRNQFERGLMYFLYPDTFDRSINLFVRGAEGVKSVTDFIYSHTSPPVQSKAQSFNDLPISEQWLNPFAFKEISVNKQELLAWVDRDYVIPILNKAKRTKFKKMELTVLSSAPNIVYASIENRYLHLRYIPPGIEKVFININLKVGLHEENYQMIINIME